MPTSEPLYSPNGRWLLIPGAKSFRLVSTNPLDDARRRRPRQFSLMEAESFLIGSVRMREKITQVLAKPNALNDELIPLIQGEPEFGETLRRVCFQELKTRPQARTVYDWSLAIIKQPGASQEAYQRALKLSCAAARLQPGNRNYRTLEGVAHYRVGEYEEAIATLESASEIRQTTYTDMKNPFRGHAARLIFTAMAQDRLGRKSEARSSLNRARVELERLFFEASDVQTAFLREAEALVEGKQKGPRPRK